jgi:tetratricopeptide (TPR) repeat protein
MQMKRIVLIAALMSSGLAFGFTEPGSAARETQAAGTPSASAHDDEQQVVVVEAWRRDRALDAFLRGDFATAEVEFKKNVRCIRRNELQLEYALRQGMIDLARANFPNAAGVAYAPPNIHNLPLRPDQITERTCYNKEWQLYMIGLSQIQLGRFAEAKKSLSSVMRMSKEDLLFDAHYRVGLLELLEGDVEGANRRLTHLTKMERSCRARGTRCEVHADLEAATSYLSRAVAHARHGVNR